MPKPEWKELHPLSEDFSRSKIDVRCIMLIILQTVSKMEICMADKRWSMPTTIKVHDSTWSYYQMLFYLHCVSLNLSIHLFNFICILYRIDLLQLCVSYSRTIYLWVQYNICYTSLAVGEPCPTGWCLETSRNDCVKSQGLMSRSEHPATTARTHGYLSR